MEDRGDAAAKVADDGVYLGVRDPLGDCEHRVAAEARDLILRGLGPGSFGVGESYRSDSAPRKPAREKWVAGARAVGIFVLMGKSAGTA